MNIDKIKSLFGKREKLYLAAGLFCAGMSTFTEHFMDFARKDIKVGMFDGMALVLLLHVIVFLRMKHEEQKTQER